MLIVLSPVEVIPQPRSLAVDLSSLSRVAYITSRYQVIGVSAD